MICFLGDSHAANTLREAARQKGLALTEIPSDADLIFVSQDTPTDERGARDLEPIRAMVYHAEGFGKPIVLTSAVPIGFTRSLGIKHIWHMAETLRIKDAMERALYPEQFIVGVADMADPWVPKPFSNYMEAFKGTSYDDWDPWIEAVTYEEAEYAKIAINVHLAHQVHVANQLAAKASVLGCDWERIKAILQNDKRIGPHAYLDPGDPLASRHILRDWRTFHGGSA